MKTNVLKLIMKLGLIFTVSGASAGYYDNNYTYAPVVDVQPVYEYYDIPQDRRVCKRVHSTRNNSVAGGAVIGGILGGLIGNNFGKGKGRDAATATGILVGAAIGANSGKRNHRNPQYSQGRQHCYTQTEFHSEQRISGYDVAYEYNGQIYHARTQNHPGEKIRIEVNVNVAEY